MPLRSVRHPPPERSPRIDLRRHVRARFRLKCAHRSTMADRPRAFRRKMRAFGPRDPSFAHDSDKSARIGTQKPTFRAQYSLKCARPCTGNKARFSKFTVWPEHENDIRQQSLHFKTDSCFRFIRTTCMASKQTVEIF